MTEGGWGRRVVWAAVGAGLVVAAYLIFADSARAIAYHGDEGHYISYGRYFDFFVFERDFAGSEWEPNYVTLTQPMLTRYVVGGWLRARGYDLKSIPIAFDRYDHGKSLGVNWLEARVPDSGLVAEARAPMVLLAAGAVGLLYAVGVTLRGPVAGAVAGLLMIGSPYAREFMVRAVPEALLAFLLLLLGVLAVRSSDGGVLAVGWALAVGAAAGLAAAAKLTGLLSSVALLAWGILVAARAARRPSGGASRARRLGQAWRAGRGWGLAVGLALGVYVLLDPFLYPGPLVRSVALFQELIKEQEEAQRNAPLEAVYDPLERVVDVAVGSLVEAMPIGSQDQPIEALLATVGMASLMLACRRSWPSGGPLAADGLLVLTAVVYFAGVSAGLYLAWARYYVPTIALGSLMAGVGIASIVARMSAVAGRLNGTGRRQQHADATGDPGSDSQLPTTE